MRLLHEIIGPFKREPDSDPPADVSLAGIAVLQAEATIALCDALAEIGPADQAHGLRSAARRLGRALVLAGLR